MSTGISYLTETWSPVIGCSGKNCKAECWAKLLHNKRYNAYKAGKKVPACYSRPFNEVRFFPDRLDQPMRWKKPRRVGVVFLGDLFDEQAHEPWIKEVYRVMRNAEQHQFFILTKQPERMAVFHEADANSKYPMCNLPNVWNGVSITDQEDWNRMAGDFLKIPGKKWLSIEPQLGPTRFFLQCELMEISWVVIGAESGPKRRPCPHEWMIDVVRRCKAAGVPVYVKQVDMGKRVSHDPAEWPEELRVQEMP